MLGCSLQKDLLLFELYCASQRGSRNGVWQGGYLSQGRALGSLSGLVAHHQYKEESKSCAQSCHTHPGEIQWLPRAALPDNEKGHGQWTRDFDLGTAGWDRAPAWWLAGPKGVFCTIYTTKNPNL